MGMSATDILLIIALALVVASIIGFGVVYIVEKKLNDIQINVPACPVPVCPKPVCPTFNQATNNTTLDTNIIKQNIDATIQKNQIVYKTIPTTNVESNNTKHETNEKENKESFGAIGATLNNILEAVKPISIEKEKEPKNKIVMIRQGYHTRPTEPDRDVTLDQIVRPNADDIVRYNNMGVYKNIDKRQIKKVSASELSVPSTRPYGGLMREGGNNRLTVKFMSPQTNDPNNVETSSVNLYVPRLYMGKDPDVLGISYSSMELETPADVDQIGSIPINDYDGEPVALDSMMG